MVDVNLIPHPDDELRYGRWAKHVASFRSQIAELFVVLQGEFPCCSDQVLAYGMRLLCGPLPVPVGLDENQQRYAQHIKDEQQAFGPGLFLVTTDDELLRSAVRNVVEQLIADKLPLQAA